MATIQKMAEVAGGGIGSLAELYDVINGKTTSTSGGSTTVTENSSVSQEGMNAMLKSALEGTNGLAAISSGQRAAGGYGSSVNTLLTNDLLSRTASQIAQANRTSTRTTTTTPTKTTVGGITAKGATKSASFLAALQALSKSGILESFKNKKSSDPNAVVAAANGDLGYTGALIGDPGAAGATLTSGVASENSFGSFPQSSGFDAGFSNFFPETVSVDSGSGGQESGTEFISAPIVEAPVVDTTPVWEYTEDPFVIPGSFADGGSVSSTRRRKSLLLPSQSSTTGVDNSGSTGAGTGGFSAPTSSPQESFSAPGQSQGNPASTAESGNDSTQNSSESRGGDSSLGDLNLSDLANFGRAGAAIGALTGDSDLALLGNVGSILGSQNPAASLAMNLANTVTNGAAGAAYSVAKDPSLSTVSDIVMSAAIPGYGPINSLAGVFGKTVNPMQIAMNAAALAKPNSQMSTVQQTADASDRALNETNPYGGTTNVDPTTGATASADPGLTDALGNSLSGGNISTATGAASIDLSNAALGGVGDSAGVGAGDTSGGYGDIGGYAGGGEVSGPGTGVSDSIPARLSDGEYVLPADVVKMIGIEKLDKMVEKYHTPAAVQRLRSFANGGAVRTSVQQANDRGEIPESTSPRGGESLEERRQAAQRLRIEESSKGRDGEAAYRRRMGYVN